MAEATTKGHLVFACGGSLYGVAAERASEVVTLPPLTRVPGAPGHLLGVFAHRGEVIPVIDLPRLLGHADGGAQWRRAVLVRVPQGALAITASKVAGVSQLPTGLSPLGAEGVRAHLLGPAMAGVGQVSVLETQGLFEHLARGGAA